MNFISTIYKSIVFLFFIGISHLFPQENTWISNGPYGGDIQTIALHPTDMNTAFIGTQESGVWRTIDGGANWAQSSTGLLDMQVQTLAVDPIHPTIVYAGTKGAGIFKSENNGVMWTIMSSGLTSFDIRKIVIKL
jgi:photosystem II stability/assembly factor-like uncharacterized protein